jgi:ATP-dependent DNA helicase DinG
MGPEGIPPPDAYLDATFGDGGYLARAHPGYRPRAGQRAFAEAVDRAIRTGGVLLAEAPCGTGKGLGYLVPASYAAATQNKRTVVVTANLGLQDQLIEKDLPALARAVPWPVKYAVFKGRGNYACLSKIHDLEQDALRYRKPRGHGIDRDLLAWADALYAQAARAENQEDEWPIGDRKELPREPSDEDWRKLSVGAEECLKDRCPFKKRCLANRAQARGRAGSIVVTNYKVLFIHLGLASIIGDVILGPYDTIVADECHKLADLARDHFGFDPLSEASFRRAVARVPDHALAETLRRQVGGFFQRLDLLYHQRYGARLRSSSFVPEDLAAATDLLKTLGVAKDRLLAAARAKEDEAAMLAEPLEVAGDIPDGFLKRPDDDEVRQAVREATDLTKAAQGLLSCADRVRCAIDPDFDEEYVVALERTEKGAIRVISKLVHPDRVLRPALFGSRLRTVDGVPGVHPHAAFIGTSATLTTKAGDFEYIVKEIGAPLTETTTLTVGTPFDWWNQALLVLAEGMPTDPNTPAFTEAVGHALERIVVLAGGRTLGLFTSYAGMKAARERLAPVCARHGFRLLVQGDSSRARLVQTFRDEVTSVLLGVESFWAGVDVPGESLSVVVIDKLPFPPKNDPVLDRLEELEGKEAFWKYRLPRAVLALRQGAGRLIRSERCRGVIVCLDPRMITKGYGATFRESLPKTQVSRRLDAVAEFLRPQPPQPWDAP